MCPPTHPFPLGEISLYCSDDQIISFLDKCSQGLYLPPNVLENSSPFLYPPENLPEGIWYLVESIEKKESSVGFWKVKGEACKIYSDSLMIGWRTTLEYFKGKAPHGEITRWCMQEYTITQNELSEKNKIKESRSLCRVFISSTDEKHPNDCKTGIDLNQVNSAALDLPNTCITSVPDVGSDVKDKEHVAELNSKTDKKPNSPPPAVFSEQDCFSRGDYLEMKDLEDDPESNSSSSQNSSCPSKLSDEYFDSLALMRDLQEEELDKDTQKRQSSSQYNFTSVRPNNTILQPEPVTCSIVQERLTEGTLLDQRHERERSISEGSSVFADVATSSTSTRNALSDEENKRSFRKKKLKMYLCFILF